MLINLLAKLSTGSGCRFRQCRMRPRFAIAGRGGQFDPDLAHASASRKPPAATQAVRIREAKQPSVESLSPSA